MVGQNQCAFEWGSCAGNRRTGQIKMIQTQGKRDVMQRDYTAMWDKY